MRPNTIKALGVGGFVAFAIAFAVSRGAVKALLGGPPAPFNSRANLASVAGEMNRILPRPLDSQTELVSTEGLEGVLVYNYRLVNAAADEVNSNALLTTLRPVITKGACDAPETRDTFLKRGVSLRYSYADKRRVPIATFDVTPRDCGF